MAFTKQIRDVNVGSASSPVAPVQQQVESGKDVANAIRSAGAQVAKGVAQGYEMVNESRIEDYRNKTEQQVEQFITSQEDLTEEDKKNLQAFDNSMSRLSTEGRSMQHIKEFRLRAATELKRVVNEHPHLEDRYRRAAVGVLGFDPSGEQMRQLQQQAAEGDKLRQMQLEFVLRDAASLGFDMNLFPDNKDMQADYAWIKEQQRKQTLQKAAAADNNPALYLQNLPAGLAANAQAQNETAALNIRDRAAKYGIVVPDDIRLATQITGDLRQQILTNEPLRQELEADLEQTRQLLEAQIAGEVAMFDEADKKRIIDLNLANIRFLSDMLDPEKNAKDIEASLRIRKNAAIANVYQSYPEALKLEVLNEIFQTDMLPDSAKTAHFNKFQPLYNSILSGVVLNPDNTIKEVNDTTVDTSALQDTNLEEMQPVFDHFAKLANSKTENPEMLGKILANYSEVFADPELHKKKSVMDAMFAMLSNETNKAAVYEFMQDNPKLRRNMEIAYTRYAKNSVVDMSNKLRNMMSEHTEIFRRDIPPFGSEDSPFTVEIKDGQLSLGINELGFTRYRNSYTGKNADQVLSMLRRSSENMVNKFNTQYINVLNNHIKVYDELFKDNKNAPETLFALFKGTPFESMVKPKSVKPEPKFDVNGNLMGYE